VNEILQVLPEISGFLIVLTGLFGAAKGVLKATGFTKPKNKKTPPIKTNKPRRKKKHKKGRRKK